MNQYLDLTNNEWRQDYTIGLKTFRIPLKRSQKLGIGLFLASLVIPLTAAPITCPLIYKYMIRREK